eukprot:879837-Pelagomonas_calceolata.AAC.3
MSDAPSPRLICAITSVHLIRYASCPEMDYTLCAITSSCLMPNASLHRYLISYRRSPSQKTP